MTEVVFDIEANGLTPDTIWCLSAYKMGDKEHFYGPGEVQYFNNFVERNDDAIFYAHGGIGYDYPVLERLLGTGFNRQALRDTLVMSRLANPSRDGGHSLDSWGQTLGFPKGGHSEWDRYSPAMGEYCSRDVQLTCRVLEKLKSELSGFDEESLLLEHQVAWIIEQQETNGWLLDQEAAFMLLAELKEKKFELEDTVRETFRPIAKRVREVTPKTRKSDGQVSSVGLKFYGDNWSTVFSRDACFTKIEWVEFNLGSRPQIAERLMMAGWVPTKYTPKTEKGGGGNPVVDEVTLADVEGIPEVTLICDYLTVQKRIAMVQSWLDFVQEDGRVHGKVNSNGAVTGRMTHYEPNMAQVTSGAKIYGKEMRACWIAPKGYKIVGCDADGLELRMLAHYMNDPDYIKAVAEGKKEDETDAHNVNKRAAGLPSRDTAKTFIYAFLYGAGDAKIGSIVGGTSATGRKLKARFLQRTPALKDLKDRVEKASARGWLKGLDGRRIYIRSRHAALNTLLQGAGAVVMKKALVNLDRMARAHKLDFKFVGNIHDEIQAEVREDQAEHFGMLAVRAIVLAGEQLGLRCPLAAEYKVGDNWSETH